MQPWLQQETGPAISATREADQISSPRWSGQRGFARDRGWSPPLLCTPCTLTKDVALNRSLPAASVTYFSNQSKSSVVPGYPLALAAQQVLIRPRNALFSLCLEEIISPKAISGKRKEEGSAEHYFRQSRHSTGCIRPTALSLSKEEPSPATENLPLKCKGGGY